MINFYIGQTFYYVPFFNKTHPRTKGISIAVKKIGRKWIYAGDIRFDKNMQVDGGKYSAPGKLYASEEEYKAIVERDLIWAGFRRLMFASSKPAHNSVEDIRKACDFLGIEVEEHSFNMSWKTNDGGEI